MPKQLAAETVRAQDGHDAIEEFYRRGWTDGLPVVPPTRDLVSQFLDYVGLEPGTVLADIHERNRVLTAEHVAINAVMAGCRPEYMPVIIAAVEALGSPEYRFNHLASLGSPWPLMVVNGPITERIGLNNERYLFGPVSRANATISRALSLLLWNCAEAKVDGIQRGQWGNPLRFMNCIAENETSDWEPLHVQKGFQRDESAVTLVSCYPMVLQFFASRHVPELILESVMDAIATDDFHRGVYTLFVPPHYAKIFTDHGWSKQDVRNHIVENCKRSVADLKRRGRWGLFTLETEHFTGTAAEIEPGDEHRFAYLFKPCEYDKYLFGPSQMSRSSGNVADINIVVAGGDAGHRLALVVPYALSTEPVTRRIAVPE